MPKMKTHRASAKRYKLTGSGKLMRRTAFRKHLLVGKSTARLRRITDEGTISSADLDRVKQALPYASYVR
ncbi:MAG: 50S ribosomal protein L35 [Cyanobacteria bacterium NC_groundwater_1444_Ag_S-0.65um_54_12]|nr:50S ribosomal protein L35 [Cyanobacteria bacterium NC_groundwater_1444_Ag_S-0.65um_54_12]